MRRTAKPLSFLPELLELIFSYLSDKSDIDLIYTCALVSRSFHHSARYFLYAHPLFRHPHSGHFNTAKFIRFRDTVISARYGETLRSLTYTLNPKYLVDLLPHLTRLRSLDLSARNQDYHILSRRQPGQLATRLRETLSRHEFSSLKFHGYYVEDGFNTLNYLLGEAQGLKHLALSQLKTLKGYPMRPLPCEDASPVRLKSLTVGFPQLTRRHARENWIARSEVGYWVVDYFGLKSCIIYTDGLEELTIVDGGVFETRKIVEKTFASLKRLRLEGNVHLDGNFLKPFTAPSVMFDDWIKLRPYANLTTLSIDFRGNVYDEVYHDMRLMLRWLAEIIVPALPIMMPKLRNLLLKFRIDALRIRPHRCLKNYYCRQDDPRDGLGVWNRLGLILGKCNSLERLRIEISSLSYYDFPASMRSTFAHIIVGAVLNNGASPVGYGVEVDIIDSLDILQL